MRMKMLRTLSRFKTRSKRIRDSEMLQGCRAPLVSESDGFRAQCLAPSHLFIIVIF